MKVLSIVQSFPENLVTLSKFRGFVENPAYHYGVFCWDTNPKAWAHWANDVPTSHRKKVLVSGAKSAFKAPFLLEWGRFLRFLLLFPVLSSRHLRLHYPKIGLLRAIHRLLDDYQILQAKPDLLHFEFGATAVEKIYLKDLLGCKVLVSFRGFDLNFYQLANAVVYQEVWEKADACHFLGKDLYARARQRGMPEDKKYQIIPPGVDLAQFKPKNEQKNKISDHLQVVSVGRLIWKKGLPYGLLAFAAFIKKGGKGQYHLVGEGPAREELTYYAQELGISERVTFHGICSPPTVQRILEHSDVLLHPALSEGFCNAVLEAQAMELPVVCFAVGGLPENVLADETGFIVPIWDWQQMAEKLIFLHKNPENRRKMGQKGRIRVAEHFSTAALVQSFDSLYSSLLTPAQTQDAR